MIWVLLWFYIMGALNEFLFASVNGVDLSRWQNHVMVALWPITVPAAFALATYESITGKDSE